MKQYPRFNTAYLTLGCTTGFTAGVNSASFIRRLSAASISLAQPSRATSLKFYLTMRVIINAQFVLVSALYVAQIMQICCDDDGVANMKYEILKLDEYISLVAEREISQSKGKFEDNTKYDHLD